MSNGDQPSESQDALRDKGTSPKEKGTARGPHRTTPAAQKKKAVSQADAVKLVKDLRPIFQEVFSRRVGKQKVTYGSAIGDHVPITVAAEADFRAALEAESKALANDLERLFCKFAPEVVQKKLQDYYKTIKEPFPADRLGVVDENCKLTREEKVVIFSLLKAMLGHVTTEEADRTAGFFARKTGQIFVKESSAEAGTIAHEMTHAYADGAWHDFTFLMYARRMKSTDELDEGMTGYLAKVVVDRWWSAQPSGTLIPDPSGYGVLYKKRATEFVTSVGKAAALEAFFAGEIEWTDNDLPEDTLVIGSRKKSWRWPWR
jgi:hypothetical protein